MAEATLVIVFKSSAVVELSGDADMIAKAQGDYHANPSRVTPSAIDYVEGGSITVVYADLSGMVSIPHEA
jgi:hypothetical protein